MKFSISSILLFSMVIIGVLNSFSAHDYGPMIKDVHDKYRTLSVLITLGKNQLSFERITIWHETNRILSNEGISTLIINLKQFEDKSKTLDPKSDRLLIVIAFDTIEELLTFESITKGLYMKNSVWLMVFTRDASRNVCEYCRNPHGSLSNPKFGSKVLISCCDSMTIEGWSTEKNLLKRQELGRLTDGNTGIIWSPDDVDPSRRYSLNGQELRIAAVRISVMLWVEDGEYCGLFGELLKELSRSMNFTVSEIMWGDDYGRWDPETSKWTEAVGMVHRGEVDIGVADFVMSPERLHAIEFTSPITRGWLQVHFRKYDPDRLLWNAYLKGFTPRVWMGIITLILITPFLLTLIRYKRGSHFFSLHIEHHLILLGNYCGQGLPDAPKETPTRIVYFSILLSVVVLVYGAYSAAMISSLAVSSYSSFSTMEELVEDGSYKFIAVNNMVSDVEYLEEEYLKKIWRLMKPESLQPKSIEEAFDQVCSERVAYFLDDGSKMAVQNSIPCEVTSLIAGGIGNAAIIMPKGSPYLKPVNYYIERFRTNGMLNNLMEKYYKKLDRNEIKMLSVHLEGIFPIVLVLALGFLIAFFIFIVERCVYSALKKLCNRGKSIFFGENAGAFRFKRM